MELIIVRPPLVVGSGSRGNVSALAKAISLGIPLPLGDFPQNRRSMIGVSDLSDFLVHLILCKDNISGSYLIQSDHPYSTAALLQMLGEGLMRPPRIIKVPIHLIKVTGKLLGFGDLVDRLSCDLEVDDLYTRKYFGWTPKYGLSFECQNIAKDYKFVANR
jgi:UDP-glucose 4-epimerase